MLKFFWTFSGKKKFFAGNNSSLYFDIFEKERENEGGVGGRKGGVGGMGWEEEEVVEEGRGDWFLNSTLAQNSLWVKCLAMQPCKWDHPY